MQEHPLVPLIKPEFRVGVRVVKNLPTNAGDIRDSGSIPGLGRSPGGGHDNPLHYSCLENPMDRGAEQATVHSVAQSQTRLKRLSTHIHMHMGRAPSLPCWLLLYCSGNPQVSTSNSAPGSTIWPICRWFGTHGQAHTSSPYMWCHLVRFSPVVSLSTL